MTALTMDPTAANGIRVRAAGLAAAAHLLYEDASRFSEQPLEQGDLLTLAVAAHHVELAQQLIDQILAGSDDPGLRAAA